MAIDLNCDMGESFGAWTMGEDEKVMPHITSANIACGFHAGDALTMRASVQLARRHGVAIGAHVSLPDLQGFGRREMKITPEEAHGFVAYQVGALAAIARAEGAELSHVKPHGALYHMVARSPALAEAVARAVRDVDASLVLFGLSGGALIGAGEGLGLAVANEVFADRAYRMDGSLVPRGEKGAVIDDAGTAAGQVAMLATEGRVKAVDGSFVTLTADTVCVHGDRPGAGAFAAALRARLELRNVVVRAPERRPR
jgi:UPF0271 protein